jgi:hypothetical protein
MMKDGQWIPATISICSQFQWAKVIRWQIVARNGLQCDRLKLQYAWGFLGWHSRIKGDEEARPLGDR